MTMTFRSMAAVLLVAVLAAATIVVAEASEHSTLRVIEGHSDLMANAMEQLDEEMMMESETTRRLLAGQQRRRYISYAALARNNIPCNQRGQSYYNCVGHQRANPYTRGCTRITHCARNTR